MTMCESASGGLIASGGRAWISLCSATRCGWLFFSSILPSKPRIVTQGHATQRTKDGRTFVGHRGTGFAGPLVAPP